MKHFSIILVIAFSLAMSAFPAFANDVIISQKRLDFIAKNFDSSLGKIDSKGGAICVVQNGKTIFGRDFSDVSKDGFIKKFPLGNTSQTLVSLMLLAMEDYGIVAPTWKVYRHCSYFSDKCNASFSDLLSMRAGFDSRSDALVPNDASAEETFSIASQIMSATKASESFSRSRLSSALAGYALGYIFDKREKNMKKSFAACSDKYLFKPLKFSSPRFSSFNLSMFPATAYALSIEDIAKWLECETSKLPTISNATSIAFRRTSEDAKFSNGWLSSTENGIAFFVSADYWENCANVVAVFPAQNVAVAFIACSKDSKKASKLCADSLSKFIELLTNF